MIAGEPFGTGCGQRVPFPGSAFLERKHRRSMWSTSAAPPDEQASCPRTMLVRCSFRNSSPPLVMHLDWGPAGHDHPPELHPIGWRALSRAPFSARSCSGMAPRMEVMCVLAIGPPTTGPAHPPLSAAVSGPGIPAFWRHYHLKTMNMFARLP